MSVAFIFPGQGSQSPGMLHNLMEHPAVHRTLEEISEELHSDIRNFDTEHYLESSVSVQLGLFAAGVSSALALMEQGIRPVAVSGLSVGAFAAAVTAGVLGLRDAVELVRLRAEEMIKLYPNGYGLSAILGLTEILVTRIVEAASTPNSPVFVGNINAPRQIVIAGAHVAMDKVLEVALRQGARKAVRLHVPVLSHCPLLRPVANKLQERISAMSIRTPGAIYVGNINARPLRKKEQVSNDLANNIAHGVRWHDATTVLKELGCSLFLEMPPGHVLSNLAQENLSDVKSVPVESSSLSKILHLARSSR